MAKRTMNTYTVYAIVEMNVAVKIEADSLSDAVERSKSLKEYDFVKPLGDFNDGAIEISGVFDEQVDMKHRD
jgi:hypothetical protein